MKKKVARMIHYKDGTRHFECDECGLTGDGGLVCKHFPDDTEFVEK